MMCRICVLSIRGEEKNDHSQTKKRINSKGQSHHVKQANSPLSKASCALRRNCCAIAAPIVGRDIIIV